MISLESVTLIREIVTIFGVIAGVSYYILSVRNQNQARKAQLLLNLNSDLYDPENWKRGVEQMQWKWDSYDDFVSKYGVSVNPDAYAIRIADLYWYNNIGLMLKKGLLDEDLCYDMYGSMIILTWEHWKEIIFKERDSMGPNWMEHWEYWVERMKAVQRKRNIDWSPSNQ